MRVLISIATHHPTSSTIPIVQAAAEVLDRIFVQGVQYKRAGVIVMGISPNSPIQQDLFDVTAEQIGKMKRLDKVVDRINKSEWFALSLQSTYKQDNLWGYLICLKNTYGFVNTILMTNISLLHQSYMKYR